LFVQLEHVAENRKEEANKDYEDMGSEHAIRERSENENCPGYINARENPARANKTSNK
jgi:hypothetical protein